MGLRLHRHDDTGVVHVHGPPVLGREIDVHARGVDDVEGVVHVHLVNRLVASRVAVPLPNVVRAGVDTRVQRELLHGLGHDLVVVHPVNAADGASHTHHTNSGGNAPSQVGTSSNRTLQVRKQASTPYEQSTPTTRRSHYLYLDPAGADTVNVYLKS